MNNERYVARGLSALLYLFKPPLGSVREFAMFHFTFLSCQI